MSDDKDGREETQEDKGPSANEVDIVLGQMSDNEDGTEETQEDCPSVNEVNIVGHRCLIMKMAEKRSKRKKVHLRMKSIFITDTLTNQILVQKDTGQERHSNIRSQEQTLMSSSTRTFMKQLKINCSSGKMSDETSFKK